MLLRIFLLITLVLTTALAIQYEQLNGGVLTLTWGGTMVSTTASFVLGFVTFVTIISFWGGQLWAFVKNLPYRLKNSRQNKHIEAGITAIFQGLTALQAGDEKQAQKYAKKVKNLLPNSNLNAFLVASIAEQGGDSVTAKKNYAELTQSPQTEFLGYKGLLESAIKEKRWPDALNAAEKLLEINPKSPYVLKNLYRVCLFNNDLEQAEELLTKLKKQKLFSNEEFLFESSCIAMQKANRLNKQQALEVTQKALKACSNFYPLLEKNIDILKSQNAEPKQLEKPLTAFWRSCPRMEVFDLWEKSQQHQSPSALVKSAEKFTKPHAQTSFGMLAMAKVYLQVKDAKRAEELALKAHKINAGAESANLLAQLQPRNATTWLKQAVNLPLASDSLPAYIKAYSRWLDVYINQTSDIKLLNK